MPDSRIASNKRTVPSAVISPVYSGFEAHQNMALSAQVIDFIGLKPIRNRIDLSSRRGRRSAEQLRFAFVPVGKDAIDARVLKLLERRLMPCTT